MGEQAKLAKVNNELAGTGYQLKTAGLRLRLVNEDGDNLGVTATSVPSALQKIREMQAEEGRPIWWATPTLQKLDPQGASKSKRTKLCQRGARRDEQARRGVYEDGGQR